MANLEEIKQQLENTEGVAGYYKELLNAMKAENEAKKTAKEAEDKLKDVIALANSSYKKDGTTLDTSGIKMPSLNGAMEVHFGGVDKIEEAAQLKDEYIDMIQKGDIPVAQIEGLSMKRASIKEQTNQVKDSKDNLKVKMEPEIVEALFLVAKEEIQLINDATDVDKDGNPKKKKAKKDPLGDNPFDLIKAIKDYLGKL